MSFSKATTRRAIGFGVLVFAMLTFGIAPAWASTASTNLRFHGLRLSVPATWRVFDLARDPQTCVRFNRHAVYLGVPGADQRCPAHEVGRTAAILVTPLSAASASSRTATAFRHRGAILPGAGREGAAVTYVSGAVQITATWGRQRALVGAILRRRLSRPERPSAVAAAGPRSSRSAGRRRGIRPDRARSMLRAVPAEATYGGLGFDACSAPSPRAMTDWTSSPYRAIGVYIGGINAACSQPNLTPAWVGAQVGAGWHLIPTYVGLQGRGSCSGTCATISPGQAAAQGTAAAADAVAQAQALGIPGGNPIYDDMEQYTQSTSNTAAVLGYLSAWTTQLHADGYLSGVYSSASSAITDLVDATATGFPEPDDIWIADWNGEHTTSDPYVPTAEWSLHQRLHQYSGAHNETYGGATINIDGDYLDGATADTSSPIPDGTFVQAAGTADVYRIAGGAPLYVSDQTLFGPAQPIDVISPATFAGLSPYPRDGTFLTTTGGNVYRVAGGAPIRVTSWTLFGGPLASVTVDQWDLDNISNPAAHLLAAPIDGTVVEGLPSQAYWSFSGGQRTQLTPAADAVAVDDNGLAGFPIAVSATGGAPPVPHVAAARCVVPRLKHMSLRRARSALRRAHCRLGRVRRPRRWGRHHLLRVFGQSVAPHRIRPALARVNIRML